MVALSLLKIKYQPAANICTFIMLI